MFLYANHFDTQVMRGKFGNAFLPTSDIPQEFLRSPSSISPLSVSILAVVHKSSQGLPRPDSRVRAVWYSARIGRRERARDPSA